MKLLIVNQSYPPHPGRGPAISVRSIAHAIAGDGTEVVVAASPDVAEPALREDGPVRVYDIPRRDRPLDALAGVIERERPDIVHTNSIPAFTPRSWDVARSRGARVVHTLREYALLCRTMQLYVNDAPCRALCVACQGLAARRRDLSRGVDAVVGISRHVLRRHLDLGFFAETRLREVIHNGVDPPPAPRPPVAPGTPLRLGYLGRIEAAKGVLLLLDALAELRDRPWTLAVGGTGSRESLAALAARAAGLPVDCRGQVEAAAFYPSIDVLVVPSLWEDPLPRVAVEGLAAGLPVVISDRGGLPELAAAGPDVAVSFAAARPRTLVAALAALIEAPERARALAPACTAAVAGYSIAAMAAAYRQLYGAVRASA